MERSQSCTSFDSSHDIVSNKSRSKNNKIFSSNSSSPNLRQAIELRHAMEYCQINFKKSHQHIPRTGSSDNINKISVSSAMSTSSVSSLPLFSPRRSGKKQLQRQSTSKSNDDEFYDDIDYHADLEEEDIDIEHVTHSVRTSKNPYKKHLNFQRHKQQSESALISPSSPSSNRHLTHGESFDSAMTAATDMSPASQRRQRFAFLMRDSSVQSDSSRYSSVDSLLESRKPDPEAILINLGFGPIGSEDILSRIPKRFLKPSQVRGIDTEAFVKRLQLASNLADHSVLGYRGLTGNPDMPPSSIVAKIMQRFEVNQHKKSISSIEQTM